MDLFVLSLAAVAGLIFGFAAAIFGTGFRGGAGLTLILATLPRSSRLWFLLRRPLGRPLRRLLVGRIWADVIEIEVLALLILSALLALIGFGRLFRRRSAKCPLAC